MDFSFSSIEQLPNAKASVAFVPDSGTVFREDTKLDSRVLNGGQRFIPWGVDFPNMAVMLLGDAYLIEVFGRKANLIRPVHREGV